MLPVTTEREAEIDSLKRRIESIRGEIYRSLTPWQRVLVARHPSARASSNTWNMLFTEFTEIHGDRRFGDDHAIVTGMARYKGGAGAGRRPSQGRRRHEAEDLPQLRLRAAGRLPQGAARDGDGARSSARPIIVFVDTPAAYPGIESEERGVAEAIALNLREMAMLEVPIIVNVCGEGGSGGALGLAIGDRVLMHEFAVYPSSRPRAAPPSSGATPGGRSRRPRR